MEKERLKRLKRLVNVFWDIQDLRIASQNRFSSYVRLDMMEALGIELPKEKSLKKKEYTEDKLRKMMIEKFGLEYTEKFIEKHKEPIYENIVNQLEAIESMLEKEIKYEVSDHPVWKIFLKDVRGIGEVLAGQLLVLFDPFKAEYPSSFIKYAGLDPEGAKRERGHSLGYNPRAKGIILGRVATSLLKAKSQYCVFYYENRVKEYKKALEQGLKAPLAVSHRRAIRKMMKPFVCHLGVCLAEVEKAPIRKSPYVEEVLGHKILAWKDIKDITKKEIEVMKGNVERQLGTKSLVE